MSRSSPSRQSSFSYTDTPSRRSSVSSNPNIFSDDYALEPIDSRLDLSLQDSIQSEHTWAENDRTRDAPNITPYPAIPPRLSGLNRPNSTTKGPSASDNNSIFRDGATVRSLSTSSRFSLVRAQSPYSGPTQPSHPYAMYPQITRASSVASGSTVRAPENPFVPTGGPEHPYSLYPQNTVPEDSDDDIGTQAIPLGFPRLGIGNPGSSGRAGSDVGDIIGSDGHVEQLPPYTRYADNVVAKGDMANISDASTLVTSRRPSQRSTLRAVESPVESLEVSESSDQAILLNEDEKKESWKDKASKKVCGGIACWLLAMIIALIVFAGVIGGIVGGVVGRKQGTEIAVQAGATATRWVDADPASTDNNTPACPTGRYSIPLNQTEEVNSCVVMGNKRAWSCLDIAFLGITISDAIVNGNKTLQVRFDDYSVDTETFRYGPQPPDFNGTSFDLNPFKDRDNKELGVAMFFYKTFDKLSILPDWAIKPYGNGGGKRTLDERHLVERGDFDGRPLAIGDTPWFCFWNQTISEFWIFLEEPRPASSLLSTDSTVTAPPESSYSASSSVSVAPTSTTSNWEGMSKFPATPTFTKRGAYTTPYLPQYPQLIRMIEKRKPYGNTPPYCQRMQVLADWRIVPNENNQIVTLKELEYATRPLEKRWVKRDSMTHEVESNCVCEWMST